MKRTRIFILGVIIPCALALSGCFNWFKKKEQDIVVDLPSIEVVSTLKLNLQGRTEKSLFPSLSNNSIKNPEFSYVSSDKSVATIDASGVVRALKVGSTNVTITLKTNSSVKKDVKVNVVDAPVEHYDYTIMFYMCASDLEYDSNEEPDKQHPYISEDILEILSVHDIPESVKIIIQTGGTTKWSLPGSYLIDASKISSTNLQRWEVDNALNKLRLVETLPTNHMASESSFTEFLSWGLDDYEADQMGIVFSGHGGGIAGCAFDDNYTVKVGNDFWQRTLRTFEVAKAAKTALSNSSKEKFTWIGYDCCIMQCADIATINSDYFDYMVASQENESAIGWNHDVYLPYLKANTKIAPKDFLPKICDAFLLDKHREDEFGENTCYQTLSVLDLSKAADLVTKFNNFCESVGYGRVLYDIAKLAFERSYNNFGDKLFGLCDFVSLMNEFEKINPLYDTESIIASIESLVYYSKNCSKYHTDPCGVNAFFPEKMDSNNKYMLQVGKEDYANSLSTKFTKWQDVCVAHGEFGWNAI